MSDILHNLQTIKRFIDKEQIPEVSSLMHRKNGDICYN